jgi:hypothetical protein
MKKLFALVMGVSMLGLVAGCSDDSSDTVSCNIPTLSMCLSGSGTEKNCTDSTGTVVDTCPANPLLTCQEAGGTVYYYDQAMVDAFKLVNATDPCGATGG